MDKDQARFNVYQVALAAMVDFLKTAGQIPASVSHEDAYETLLNIDSLRFSGPDDPERREVNWRMYSPWAKPPRLLTGKVIFAAGGFDEIQATYRTGGRIVIPAGTIVAFRDSAD